MQNVLIASFLVAAVSAYDYSGPGLATWPSRGGYGYNSVCYGCHGYRLGKRSAEPSLGYGYGAVGTYQNNNNVYGHQLATGYAINQPHPGYAGSYQARTQFFSGYGKRSAEPYYYGAVGTYQNNNNVYGHQLASGYAINQPHPGYSGSYQARTQFHSGYGKRSAEPSYYGAALTLQNNNNVFGHQLGSGYAINQPHPGYAGSYQQVSRLHSGYYH